MLSCIMCFTYFQQVLSWLCNREDYFCAASIALDLLHDADSLFHLWKHAEKIDEEDEHLARQMRFLKDAYLKSIENRHDNFHRSMITLRTLVILIAITRPRPIAVTSSCLFGLVKSSMSH